MVPILRSRSGQGLLGDEMSIFMKTVFSSVIFWPGMALIGVLGFSGCETYSFGPPIVIDEKAREVLEQMSDKLAGGGDMTLRASRVTDRELADYLAVPTRATAEVMVSGPNRFRAEIREPGALQSAYFDGATLTLYHHNENLYGSERVARGTIGGALDVIEKRYGFMPPLADFITGNPYDSLTAHMKSGRYVGVETVGGVKCHHVAATGDEVDWDMWVSVGDLLPRRYVVRANGMEGRPEWRTDFLSWDFASQFPEGHFTFTPPAGADEIRMLREGEELEEITIQERLVEPMRRSPGSVRKG
jgi:hypothetical protein